VAGTPDEGVKPLGLLLVCMGQETLRGDDLSQLRDTYRRKVHEELPERAQNSDNWPIHLDHCFGRVVLDNLFEDEWYDHVDGRPAYEHLSTQELGAAIDIADRMLAEGRPAVERLNENSLRWRGKLD
jgi:hypothetical protein